MGTSVCHSPHSWAGGMGWSWPPKQGGAHPQGPDCSQPPGPFLSQQDSGPWLYPAPRAPPAQGTQGAASFFVNQSWSPGPALETPAPTWASLSLRGPWALRMILSGEGPRLPPPDRCPADGLCHPNMTPQRSGQPGPHLPLSHLSPPSLHLLSPKRLVLMVEPRHERSQLTSQEGKGEDRVVKEREKTRFVWSGRGLVCGPGLSLVLPAPPTLPAGAG